MNAEDNFSVEVAVGELREEVRALAAEVAEMNGRIEGARCHAGKQGRRRVRYDPRRRMQFGSARQPGKGNGMNKIYIAAGIGLAVAAHLVLFGGAAAYLLHLAGVDVGWLDHHHGCISPKG